MEVELEEFLNLAQALDDVLLEDETGQQVAEDLRELQRMTQAVILKGKDTARSFRQAADTLDELWKNAKKVHAFGTSISIAGGLLTTVGGVATMMSAGAATPLLMLGMGAGLAGGGTNVLTSFIEASMNSKKIKERKKTGWRLKIA